MTGADLDVFLEAVVALTALWAATLLVVLFLVVHVFGLLAEVEVGLRRLAEAVVRALAFFAAGFFLPAGFLVLREEVVFRAAFLEAVPFAFVLVLTRLATLASH